MTPSPSNEAFLRLANQARKLTQPSSVGGVVGVTLAVAYGALTLAEAFTGVMGWFIFFCVVALVSTTLVLEKQVAKLTRSIRHVGRRKLPPTPENLRKAARDAMRVPDLVFIGSLLNWLAGTVGVGIVLQLVTDTVPLSASVRVVALGFVFGPISTLLSYTLVMRRCRAAVVSLSALGLSPEEAVLALPMAANLRRRLMVFMGIAILTPLLLAIDVLNTLSQRTYAAVLAEPNPAERLLRAAELRTEAFWTVGALVIIILVMALVVAWVAGAIVSEPLQRIRTEALRIADGKLTHSSVIPAEGELWQVSSSFARLQAQLGGTLGELSRAEHSISETMKQMVGTSRRYQAGATSQASSLDQTSATTEELARSARQIADNAAEVTRMAQETLRAAEVGKASAGEFSDSMGRMHQDHTAIAESVRRLNKRVHQIADIVQAITGVADRSDLLALNAELEGTKAGETGRNFSLVAGEMRRLSENVLESTNEIGSLIEEIRGATQAAVVAAESGLGATEQGRKLARDVAERLEEIVALAGNTSDSVRTISLATQQQKAGTDQLADAMSEILRVTQTTLTATQEVSGASGNLTQLAAALHEVVRRFEFDAVRPGGENP